MLISILLSLLGPILNAGIADLRSSRVYFTWSNNSVWSKLDRAMTNRAWVQEGLLAQARFDLPGKFSDHSPCTVTLFDDIDRGATPFKFFNMWAKHDRFLEIVSRAWGLQLRGTTMYKFCRRLKAAKEPLKDLNRKEFSHCLGGSCRGNSQPGSAEVA